MVNIHSFFAFLKQPFSFNSFCFGAAPFLLIHVFSTHECSFQPRVSWWNNANWRHPYFYPYSTSVDVKLDHCDFK